MKNDTPSVHDLLKGNFFKGVPQYYKPYSETKQACYYTFSPMFQCLTNYIHVYYKELNNVKCKICVPMCELCKEISDKLCA